MGFIRAGVSTRYHACYNPYEFLVYSDQAAHFVVHTFRAQLASKNTPTIVGNVGVPLLARWGARSLKVPVEVVGFWKSKNLPAQEITFARIQMCSIYASRKKKSSTKVSLYL